ncbi:MAG TPA: hypothetical protein DCY79_02610 [Planctomycetaceae bacterium]|jgi:hypothetical protein|nr:hypothetical protein [Blastopirellula sp.]HAY78682.1 hypothetical protein [Planctomycetaceae bacterium]|tara:strand:+ start:1797 stop:2150 length:354 start_codon:yes stop_codon:yes gene_type:complete
MSHQSIAPTTQQDLDRLFANVALLNDDGTITQVNRAWQTFANANHCAMNDYGVGSNYLQICDTAANTGLEEARMVAAGIRQVISGHCKRWVYHYEDGWRVECWQVASGLIVAHFPID